MTKKLVIIFSREWGIIIIQLNYIALWTHDVLYFQNDARRGNSTVALKFKKIKKGDPKNFVSFWSENIYKRFKYIKYIKD